MTNHSKNVQLGPRLRAEIQFAEFYRTHLRRRIGARVRSSDLLAAYLVWAQRGYGESIGFKWLSRFMRERNHRHFYSNNAWFADVEILEPGDVVIGTADAHQYELSYALDLVARLDMIVADLTQLRSRLADGLP